MEEHYIDIHDSKAQFVRARTRLLADTRITEVNRGLIDQFFREAALGKTVVGRARKKIGPHRLRNCAKHFSAMADYLPDDLRKATPEEIERLVVAIESDQIRSKSVRVVDGQKGPTGDVLSSQYKADIKGTIKKFYKWLLGGNKAYPELVEWIDTFVQHREIPALTEDEIAALLERATSAFDRALIQVLFDGGFRIGELLNVRLRHVRFMPFDTAHPENRCFVIRVAFSKTIRRTVVLPMPATTKWLNAWLEEHPAGPVVLGGGGDGMLQAGDLEHPLFSLTVPTCNRHLRALGQRVLGKKVYPHLLRHSSATYWSNKLSYFQQCKRFGWSLTSKMPQRYIDRQGIDDFAVAKAYWNDPDREPRSRSSSATGTIPALADTTGARTPQQDKTSDLLACHGRNSRIRSASPIFNE